MSGWPSLLCSSATPSHEWPSLAVTLSMVKRLDPSWQQSPSKRPGWQLGSSQCCRWHQSHRSVWAPLSVHPGRASSCTCGWGSTNKAMIWPEFELENIFMCLICHKPSGFQMVPQYTSISYSISISVSTGRNLIFNYRLHWWITHPMPPLAEANTLKSIPCISFYSSFWSYLFKCWKKS